MSKKRILISGGGTGGHIFPAVAIANAARRLLKLRKSMSLARRVIRDFRPDIAVGVGGYASGAALKEAQRLGVPTLIQEQNSFAGVTNKLLAKKTLAICTAYEGMERFFPADKIILTGNPVRSNITDTDVSIADARR